MSHKLLLVDFENVQQIDVCKLDEHCQVIIFVGGNQKSVPIDLVTNAQKLGSRVEWLKVEGNGTNALDFFIAYQLGRVVQKSPQLHCIVLSKDKGFDPLLKYLNKNGLKCKRINSQLELDSKAANAAATADEPNYKRVVEVLGKSEKKSRPRKLKTLSQHISSMFQKKITQKEIEQIIDLLFVNKLISETNNKVTYEF
jgi:hypothetical protein